MEIVLNGVLALIQSVTLESVKMRTGPSMSGTPSMAPSPAAVSRLV